MFFFIGDTPSLQSLTKVENELYLDKGWSNSGNTWYKGYSTECTLSESLDLILAGYQPAGKWCVINGGDVYHPSFRGFPLWKSGKQLTNIKTENFEVVPAIESEPINNSEISLDEAAIQIGDILLENTKNFFKFNDIDKMNVLFSGGLDTLTSWAVLDSVTKNYNLHTYLPKPIDTQSVYATLGRIREYESDLADLVSKEHWGYGISSFYNDTNWYLTGYYAEVIQFRDADAIYALSSYKDKFIDEIAEPDDYLYWFLKRTSLNKYKQQKLQFDSEQSLKKYLFSTVFYDYQMWHFDKNMTFSPFFDIRIPNVMLQVSVDDITKNAMTGLVQRKIVERFNPQLLTLLSDFKNEKSVFGNFRKNFSKIKLDPNVKINLR